MKKPRNIYQSRQPNVPQEPNVPQPTSWSHGEAIVILITINERKRIWDDMWLCPRCGTASPKQIEKMETRKLSGKHHRTNILQISQRVEIIVIVAATKYNPNCTPSNIKNIWTWQSQTDEISTILDAQMKAQPNPVLSKGASKATAADDQIRWALAKFEKRWVYLKKWTIHEYPKSILHWQFCWHFQTRVRSRLQTLSRMHSFQTISASGPREILHADFLGAFLHHDCAPRRMPLSSGSVHSENAPYFQWKIWQRSRIWKICRLEAKSFRYQFRINVNPGFVNP